VVKACIKDTLSFCYCLILLPPLLILSLLESELQYAQIDKHHKDGRVVEKGRRVIFGSAEAIIQLLGDQHINTSYVERDHLTSRHSNGRLVRQTLSY
jgi:hypothetical protein